VAADRSTAAAGNPIASLLSPWERDAGGGRRDTDSFLFFSPFLFLSSQVGVWAVASAVISNETKGISTYRFGSKSRSSGNCPETPPTQFLRIHVKRA
jgi:hypothetical protein